MNLGELEDGVSAEVFGEELLLEVLSYKNKEEENAEEVQATLVECHITLDRADNKDNADNVRLGITFPCDNDECQTLEELEAHKNNQQQCVHREQIEKWSSMLILVIHRHDIEDTCLV